MLDVALITYQPTHGEFLRVYRGPNLLVDRFCCRRCHSINWFGCYFNFSFRVVSCGREHPAAAPLRRRKLWRGGTGFIFGLFKILNWILVNRFIPPFAWLSATPLDFPYTASLPYILFSFEKMLSGVGVTLPITHSVKVKTQVQNFPFALSLEIGARFIL